MRRGLWGYQRGTPWLDSGLQSTCCVVRACNFLATSPKKIPPSLTRCPKPSMTASSASPPLYPPRSPRSSLPRVLPSPWICCCWHCLLCTGTPSILLPFRDPGPLSFGVFLPPPSLFSSRPCSSPNQWRATIMIHHCSRLDQESVLASAYWVPSHQGECLPYIDIISARMYVFLVAWWSDGFGFYRHDDNGW